MTNETKEALESRVRKAIVQEAFFRPESAIVIASTLLLSTAAWLFPDSVGIIPPAGWLLGGAILEGVLVGVSMSDPKFYEKVSAQVLRRDFQPERLKDKHLRQRMNEALDYRTRINAAIQDRADNMLRDELVQTASQIDDWLENIYDLALRIDRYQQEAAILNRDRKRAESRLNQLKSEYEGARNPAVKTQIEVTIESLERQLQTLDTLESTIRRARLQLENSLTHLGTIYSQTMLVDAKDIDRSRARRLRQEIDDEVSELNDILGAMDEVYITESAF